MYKYVYRNTINMSCYSPNYRRMKHVNSMYSTVVYIMLNPFFMRLRRVNTKVLYD